MPKGANQKLKLYYLSEIMRKKTDDEHGLTMPQIRELLAKEGVTADRKSLYDDLESLRFLGIDVYGEKVGKNYLYKVGAKQFEIAELMLLVDAIQSSKFITAKKSEELIKKVTDLASEYEAKQLKRQVVVQGRIKTMNESIYYLVDELHNAMRNNKAITFEYLQWDLNKKMIPRKEGLYETSPWALVWDDENYYLIGFDPNAGKIKYYRVDKMRKISMLDKNREGIEAYEEMDLAQYQQFSFGMFGGNPSTVKIRFRDDFVGIVIDRFGKDITIRKSPVEGWSETNVSVIVSGQFFGWIFAMTGRIKIVGPDDVVEKYQNELRNQME